jgi:hypothetical protein
MKKVSHHHPMHLSGATVTILLAIGFLGLVMFLSYLFMATNS